LTGGQVAIGTSAGAPNSGGVLRSTGDANVIENVQNVDMRNIQIVDTGGAGLIIDHTAAATTTMDVTIVGLDVVSAAGNAIDVLSAETNSTYL
jgi:hypothetical protein